MNAESVWYVDSSAIVKLVAIEPETPALSLFLEGRQPLVSSGLASTEVRRAVLPLGDRFLRQARDVLARLELVRVSPEVLEDAGGWNPRVSDPSIQSIWPPRRSLAALWAVSSHMTGECATRHCRMAGVFTHRSDSHGSEESPVARTRSALDSLRHPRWEPGAVLYTAAHVDENPNLFDRRPEAPNR
jgi:hypothetical protein